MEESDDYNDYIDHPLAQFFKNYEGKSGVYFITQNYDPDFPNNRIAVKIGLSKHRIGHRDHPDPKKRVPYGGLGRRLDSYLLCYVEGYYIFAVLECSRDNAQSVEKFFHEYYTSKNFKSEHLHSHKEEWYYLQPNEIYSTIRAYDETNEGTLTTMHIFDPPTFIDTNGRIAQHPKKPMKEEQKQSFQSSMRELEIPGTIKKRSKRDDDQRDDM